MFFKYPDIPPGSLAEDRELRAKFLGERLPRSKIVDIRNREVTLELVDNGEHVVGDVAHAGFTVYFGGFDWVTFPTPQHVLQKFPQFLPLPQPSYDDDGLL